MPPIWNAQPLQPCTSQLWILFQIRITSHQKDCQHPKNWENNITLKSEFLPPPWLLRCPFFCGRTTHSEFSTAPPTTPRQGTVRPIPLPADPSRRGWRLHSCHTMHESLREWNLGRSHCLCGSGRLKGATWLLKKKKYAGKFLWAR